MPEALPEVGAVKISPCVGVDRLDTLAVVLAMPIHPSRPLCLDLGPREAAHLAHEGHDG
jgi:hypothetical protein